MIIIYTIIINKFCGLNINYLLIGVIDPNFKYFKPNGRLSSIILVKRFTGIKDYSNLIPGHGGMLDRIVSIIFIAPFAYFLLVLI